MDGWRKGGLEQQNDEGLGCYRLEGVEKPGAYVNDEAIFASSCDLSDRPLAIWWSITWREVGSRCMLRSR